jgi:flagellar protein FlbD
MIQLTRLNNACLALNSDLIKYVEQAPDTVITLVNGEKLLVRETTEQVIERVRDFRRSILTGICCTGLPSQSPDRSRSEGPANPSPESEGPLRG